MNVENFTAFPHGITETRLTADGMGNRLTVTVRKTRLTVTVRENRLNGQRILEWGSVPRRDSTVKIMLQEESCR